MNSGKEFNTFIIRFFKTYIILLFILIMLVIDESTTTNNNNNNSIEFSIDNYFRTLIKENDLLGHSKTKSIIEGYSSSIGFTEDETNNLIENYISYLEEDTISNSKPITLSLVLAVVTLVFIIVYYLLL